MSSGGFATWLARGRAHQEQGRAADAIPCYRRAAREDPRSPVPHFHLGEAWWQLGLAREAVDAWRASARIDATFLPPRLALAEAAMAQGDYALAREIGDEAAALAPADARARATAHAARAAAGDRAALDACARDVAADPSLAHAPSLAGALARALAQARDGDEFARLVAALTPHAATLPTALLAALAESGVMLPDAVAARRVTGDDVESLRRLAVALHARQPHLAGHFTAAYCALCAALPRPAVPLLWPQRTGGTLLRVAWLLPPQASASWHAAAEALRSVAGARPLSLVVVCTADADATRAALAGAVNAAVFVTLELPAGANAAKVLAARDCDVLVDAAGLAAPTARMLLARPARAVWALDVGAPLHREPVIDRAFAGARDLERAMAGVDLTGGTLSADALAGAWDAAVLAHRDGNLAQASAGYANVLAHQPRFAPALHLAGVAAAAINDRTRAQEAFAAALAAEPGFSEVRVAAADLALAEGDASRALTLIEEGLARSPGEDALWRALGRIHLRRRDTQAAIAACERVLLLAPADADAHFEHGVALQRKGDAPAGARAYQRALTFRPDMIAADFNLGVLFQEQGNREAAIAAYTQVLRADPAQVGAYKHLGDVLLAAGDIDAWLANFRAFETHCPSALPLAVYALEACQHLADFDRLQRYLDGLRRDEFHARDEDELADCLESLLYLLLFFDIEPSVLLRLAQAYDGVVPRVYGARVELPARRKPGPLRIGYLSGDLRNHVMGKMMWQAVQYHDRDRFELHFYSNARARDEWTQRFEGVAHRFVEIAGLDDAAAVAEVLADDLDLLVDLSTHTQGSRPGVLARKPARVQLTHVASAGVVGLSQVGFKLTDRYADVPESQEFMIERLLAMEGCVFPFRRVEPAASHPFHRSALGISSDAVVIGAFVSPLKLSRRCLRLWREVLARVPRALLAFSPANPAMRASYVRLAAAAGIAGERLLFLPQGRDDAQNQARYYLIDFVLDTMPFGGVNGTIEALAMNVPVVTLLGKRHGERTTYSILANAGVTQTIAQTGPEYVAVAVRLADDAEFRHTVRSAIAAGIAHSPLTDMPAYTRHLEAAYLAAMAASP
ncbi:MAG: tetratricopeptide repeat protein [Burkholderiales bacterium]|nr:tetratricopeptide repeat protein [Burkholderiales bacterium]